MVPVRISSLLTLLLLLNVCFLGVVLGIVLRIMRRLGNPGIEFSESLVAMLLWRLVVRGKL